MSDNNRIMAFTKRHFNVKPNIAKVTCGRWKRAHYWRNQGMLICGGQENGTKYLTWPKLKCPPCIYTASVVVSVNTVQALEMQLIWSHCKHSIMSQIVAKWALFNFILFSDGTLWLMKNNRKCEVNAPAFLECNCHCLCNVWRHVEKGMQLTHGVQSIRRQASEEMQAQNTR